MRASAFTASRFDDSAEPQAQLSVRSPLNYSGGKFKLLPQLIPYFPKDLNTFVDLFCGGCNVGINVQAAHVIFNDNLTYLIDLYKEVI